MIRTKDYLSWSQYDLWKKSKRTYWKKYGLLEESHSNKFFDKGKELADGLENGPNGISMDPLYEQVLKAVPKLDIQEDRVEVVLENGEKLLSWVDSAAVTNDYFIEYKTGKDAWDQTKVDHHGQLAFYALAYYIKSGRKTIPQCELIWVETYEHELDDGGTVLRYTGAIESFKRGFLLSELVDLEKDIIKTIKDIEEFEYIEMPLEESLVDRYMELKAIKEEAESEMNTIKLEISVEMDADEVDYASSDNGRFSFTKRKTWYYSDKLANRAERIKKLLKSFQKAEQKNGTAKYTETKSITFKAIE